MPRKIPLVELPIEWNVPDDLVARYATNMVVQKTENEYIISFFEINQPIILAEPEKIEEYLKGLKSIRANCVARIIVAADKMPSFVSALDTNLKRNIEDAKDNEIKVKE